MRIALAEDETQIRALLAGALLRRGHEVVEAVDGAEALRLLETETVLDALITDIRMPGADGWTVARAYRARFPALPVFYVTGFSEEDGAVSGGVLIRKPYRVSQILLLLSELPGWSNEGRPELYAKAAE